MFKVHLQYGFSSIKLVALTASGAKFGPMGASGPFAIDRLMGDAVSNHLRHSEFVALCDEKDRKEVVRELQGIRLLSES
jgi:putative oxidoreductase